MNKDLFHIKFTDSARKEAEQYLAELESPLLANEFINLLTLEFEDTESVDHQMLNLGDVLRIIDKQNHDRKR